MLKLWIGRKEFDNMVGEPDYYFSDFIDPRCIDTEFGRRVVKELSRVKTVVNYATLILPTGEFISPKELSSGAKNVLIMENDTNNAVCDMLWCGENCEKFVAEISCRKDLFVESTRWFLPYRNADFKDGVKIMNTGMVVRSAKEYLDHIYDTGLDDLFE